MFEQNDTVRRGLLVCALLLAAGSGAVRAESAAAKLKVAEADPPNIVSDPIKVLLDKSVYQFSDKDGLFFELWMRKELPLAEKPKSEDVGFDAVQPGAIIGVLKVHKERYDFRDEEILPGVYVLRYAKQPEDGDHLGTAPTTTFALLIPAKDDVKADPITNPEDLHDASAVINAAEHPSNLNIQRVETKDGTFPRLSSHHDDKHQVIYLQLPAKAKGMAKPVPLMFALVYDGVGEV